MTIETRPAPEKLTAAAAFRRAADAACRDGRVDEWESRLLNRLYRRLDLTKEEASFAVVAARKAAGEVDDDATGGAPLETYPLYRDLLGLAFADQQLDAEEQQVLLALRELLEITDDDHMAAITELGLLCTRDNAVEGAALTPEQEADEEDAAAQAAELEAAAVAEGELKTTFAQVRNGMMVYLLVALILVGTLRGAEVGPTSTRGIWEILAGIYLACWLLLSMGHRGDVRVGRVGLTTPLGTLRVLPFDLVFLPAGLVLVPMAWGLWVWIESAVRGMLSG